MLSGSIASGSTSGFPDHGWLQQDLKFVKDNKGNSSYSRFSVSEAGGGSWTEAWDPCIYPDWLLKSIHCIKKTNKRSTQHMFVWENWTICSKQTSEYWLQQWLGHTSAFNVSVQISQTANAVTLLSKLDHHQLSWDQWVSLMWRKPSFVSCDLDLRAVTSYGRVQ